MKSFKITKGSIQKLIRKILRLKSNNWFYDTNHKFNINIDEVKKYFDSVGSTPLSKDGEKAEEKTIISLIEIKPGMKILDLGCGDGRWAKLLEDKKIKYVGVDFSKELIAKARSKNIKGEATFIIEPAQDFVLDEEFDLIFLFGLIPYMNDEEVRQISKNCSRMLKDEGRLIVRDVFFEEEGLERKVFDDQNDLTRRIFLNRIPRYQLIRRCFDTEIKLFKEFNLVNNYKIEGTKLSVKIFRKN